MAGYTVYIYIYTIYHTYSPTGLAFALRMGLFQINDV